MLTDIGRMDWIDRYFSGVLNVDELSVFEQLLDEDIILKKEFKYHQLANAVLIDEELLREKRSLKTIDYKKLNRRIWFNNNSGYLLIPFILVMTSLIILAYKIKETNSQKQSEPLKNESKIDTISVSDFLKPDEEVEQDYQDQSALVFDSIENRKTLIQKKKEVNQMLSEPEKDLSSVSKGIDSLPSKKQVIDSLSHGYVNESNVEEVTCLELDVQIEKKPSCRDQYTGEILAMVLPKSMSLTYSLGDFKNNSGKFEGLSGGVYELEVIDEKGCKTNIDFIELDEKDCFDHEYTLNKLYDNQVVFQLNDNKSGRLRIIHVKTGKEIISMFFEYGMPNSWNGKDSRGLDVKEGYYALFIEYSDGKIVKGFITVAQ